MDRYANASRLLSVAMRLLDTLHVVKLRTQVVEEVHRRVQAQQLGRRGHKGLRASERGGGTRR